MFARLMGLKTISPEELQQSVGKPDRQVTTFDVNSRQSWAKAPNAARRAKKMGYNNVQVMSAGISGWLAAQLPTESSE